MLARLALSLAAVAWPAITGAADSDSLVAELEQRVARNGVESVNAYLVARGAAEMAALHQKTVACERPAVSLTVRLSRSRHTRAVQAHGEALRAAAGSCASYLLAMVTPAEVPRVCASVASWGVVQTARELRRRIAEIDADEGLSASPRGRACRAAYLHELNTTRVVVRRAPASAVRP
jgi:hypothetical protein